jgi:hypothetical protein
VQCAVHVVCVCVFASGGIFKDALRFHLGALGRSAYVWEWGSASTFVVTTWLCVVVAGVVWPATCVCALWLMLKGSVLGARAARAVFFLNLSKLRRGKAGNFILYNFLFGVFILSR